MEAIGVKQRKDSFYNRYAKRWLDVLCVLCVLVLFWWVYAIVALLVRCKLGSPVIFCQERPGRDEKIFKMYKFRSMTDERDENGELLPDEIRLTHFGQMLRSTSLDELPELWNILKGDMSLVGPRPLLVQYLPLYNEAQHHRHDVRPGLTGLAQVNGRFNLLWQEKFAYDLQYVQSVSFFTDIKILFATVAEVFRHEDVENTELGTWYPFLGNDVEDQQITLRRQKEACTHEK